MILNFDIPDDVVEEMVRQECISATRKRIKEMQGDYTSKEFIEEQIRSVVIGTIHDFIPDLDQVIKELVDSWLKESIKSKFKYEKMTRKKLIDELVDKVFDKFEYLNNDY